jgi:hypothetical protein
MLVAARSPALNSSARNRMLIVNSFLINRLASPKYGKDRQLGKELVLISSYFSDEWRQFSRFACKGLTLLLDHSELPA